LATALLFVFLKVTEGGTPVEAAAFCAENWWRTLKVEKFFSLGFFFGWGVFFFRASRGRIEKNSRSFFFPCQNLTSPTTKTKTGQLDAVARGQPDCVRHDPAGEKREGEEQKVFPRAST